jgi:pilus assembly protein Flp/PilA
MSELIVRLMTSLQRRRDGQAMVEYALILALVSVAAIVALTIIGTDVRLLFENVGARMNGVPGV